MTRLTERPWYDYLFLTLAVGALIASGYFFAAYHGWLPGSSGRLSSLLLLGTTTAFLWAQLLPRRFGGLALALQLAGAALLVWSIAALGRGD